MKYKFPLSCSDNSGELTLFGVLQNIKLGLYFQERYRDHFPFDQDARILELQKTVHVHSTKVRRAYLSAAALIYSFLPSNISIPSLISFLNGIHIHESHLFCLNITLPLDNSLINSCGCPWIYQSYVQFTQELEIFQKNLSEDINYQLKHILYDGQKKFKRVTARTIFDTLLPMVCHYPNNYETRDKSTYDKYYQLKHSPNENFSLCRISPNLFECIHSNQLDILLHQLKSHHEFQTQNLAFKYFSYFQIRSLLHRIIDSFDKGVYPDGELNQAKLEIFSAHDTTLSPLLTHLNSFTDRNYIWNKDDISYHYLIPYSARVVFEFWYPMSNTISTTFNSESPNSTCLPKGMSELPVIRILYNGFPLTLKKSNLIHDCKIVEQLIPYSIFKNRSLPLSFKPSKFNAYNHKTLKNCFMPY
ncbi:unnamed protein product [Gordionus sp. m RMFG-2023]